MEVSASASTTEATNRMPKLPTIDRERSATRSGNIPEDSTRREGLSACVQFDAGVRTVDTNDEPSSGLGRPRNKAPLGPEDRATATPRGARRRVGGAGTIDDRDIEVEDPLGGLPRHRGPAGALPVPPLERIAELTLK